MHTIIRRMQESKQLRESSSSTLSSCSDTDDCSSVDDSSSKKDNIKPAIKSKRKHNDSKRCRRRRAPNNTTTSSEVQALRQEIVKLECTQDQMETYRLNLELHYRCLERQLVSVDFSKQVVERKNRELEQEMWDIVKDQFPFDTRIRRHRHHHHGLITSSSIDKMEQDTTPLKLDCSRSKIES